MTDYAIAGCTETNQYLLRNAESGSVSPAKAGVYGEKTGFLFSQE